MLRRRRRPPVLAELPAGAAEPVRPGRLGRAELEVFGGLLPAAGSARTLLTTGEEAKSALAVGLATAAAAEGRRVALVECDLAAPVLASRLGLDPAPGLHEYLRLEAEAAAIVQALVLAGPASAGAVAPLACVVAGTPAAEGAEPLASEWLAHAIAKLRSAYELVVLDGPRLLDLSSLLSVAPYADVTLSCGDRKGLARKPPVEVDGVVVTG
jgi:Mrp family chromosome partitioning ATPase